MHVLAALPSCEKVRNHACVSLPANDIVNATPLRQSHSFGHTCRSMFDRKQAKPDTLDYDCNKTLAQKQMVTQTKTRYLIRLQQCPASNTAFSLRPRSSMLPTKVYDRFSPPLTTIPSQSPRLCYFISRSNGTDELPYSVRLAGVPRAMNIEHSCGMSHIGTHAFTGQLFQLESVDAAQHVIDRINTCQINPSTPKQRHAASDPILYTSEQGRPATRSPPRSEQSASQQLPVSATATTWRRVDDATSAKSQEIIDSIVAQASNSPVRKSETAIKISRTPSSSPKSSSEQKDKIYCSYWIRSGECDYTQQGCRYKHEMPDKATLASIGFRTVPRWWQEKVAIQLGQSAIPTVGPVMKPEEWLKQRRDSQDSQSDEESGSEQASEAGDEQDSDVDAAPTSIVQHSAIVLDPAEKLDEQAAASGLERIDDSLNKAVTQAPIMATTETANERYRKLSDGDLIDLSPISPTRTNPCKSDDSTTVNPIKSTEPYPTKPPSPSLPATASKQPIVSPRKVFVPAGESTEFHVADARKHAQTQKIEPEKDSIEAKQCKAGNPNTEKHSSTTPVTIPKRPEPKSGLMASMHAPPSDNQNSPHSNSLPRPSTKKQQRQPKANSSPSPKPKEAENARTKNKAKVSSSCSRPASRTAGTLDPTMRKAATVDDKGGALPKPARSATTTGKESPKSVCRPRRPAASSSSKAVASRAVTGGTKE
jgi:hypothetical protein